MPVEDSGDIDDSDEETDEILDDTKALPFLNEEVEDDDNADEPVGNTTEKSTGHVVMQTLFYILAGLILLAIVFLVLVSCVSFSDTGISFSNRCGNYFRM